MKKSNNALIIFSLLFLFSCGSSNDSSGILLKFNFEKGKNYEYEMIWDLDQKMMEANSKINMYALYSLDVNGKEGDITSITGKYNRFKLYMKMMGEEMEIDTDKPVPPPDSTAVRNPMEMASGAFKGIVGKPFNLKVNEQGEVLEVTGFEEIVQSMVDSMGLAGEQSQMVFLSIKDQFNEQNIKDQFAHVFTIFPNKIVKKGDTWNKTFSTGGAMAATYATKYTVNSIEGNIVTITSKSLITARDSEMDIKGEQLGTIIVDSRTGLATNSEFTQDIEAEVQNMTLNIKGTGKITGREN